MIWGLEKLFQEYRNLICARENVTRKERDTGKGVSYILFYVQFLKVLMG